MVWYLGTHMPHWLSMTDVPLFVCRRRLAARRRLPRARGRWACDSGGFSELSLHGQWTIGDRALVVDVRRFNDEIGQINWCAPRDWMCEPWILRRTGLSVEEHQRRTIASVIELRSIAPDLQWIPVLQGWSEADYLHHVAAYLAAGIDLAREPVVGRGSVCRRQSTAMARRLIGRLTHQGLRLHGFGFKVSGLRAILHGLVSADSMAWSYRARRSAPILGHTHKTCANCIDFALAYRERLVGALAKQSTMQLALGFI